MNIIEQEAYVRTAAIEYDQERYFYGRVHSTVAMVAFATAGVAGTLSADYAEAGVASVIAGGAFCLRKFFQQKARDAAAVDYQPTPKSISRVRSHNEKTFATYDRLIASHS